MNTTTWKILFLLQGMIIIFFVSCTVNKTTHVKVTDAYQQDQLADPLKVAVWQVSEETLRICFQVDTRNLLYKKELRAPSFEARYRIHYENYNLEFPKTVADSLSWNFTDTTQYTNRLPVLDSVDIKIPVKGKYILQMKLTDLNNNAENLVYFKVDNTSVTGRHHFIMRKADGSILFQPYQDRPADPVYLKTSFKEIPRLFVRYYKREYPTALPPFEERRAKTFSYKPDSVFFIELNDGASGPISLAEKGIYHIQTDTTTREGFTWFSFYKGFPKVTTATQMLLPLRYICSKAEFNDMMLMKNSKEAVDDFWLDIAGNPDRAKELIRKYYSRVETANLYFTSYHEGWKTDRGIIYIVYGPPSIVYRNPDSETWIYGEDRNILSMTFNFNRIENPFTVNDYELDRSLEYKETWYSALEGWRN